ncbi:MAG: hypothetical protein WCB68_14695 [Pyrinomonadaceae bacterium]
MPAIIPPEKPAVKGNLGPALTLIAKRKPAGIEQGRTPCLADFRLKKGCERRS